MLATLDHGWEAGGSELTPTMKLRRRAITERYAAEIEALHASGGLTGSSEAIRSTS